MKPMVARAVVCLSSVLLFAVGHADAGPSVTIAGTPNVAVVNTPTVQVGNSATSPVQTRDVDSPARLRWQGAAQVLFSSPDTQLVATFAPAIPAGKILVIEYLTAQGALPTGQKLRFILFNNAGFTIVQHYFAPTFVGTDTGVDNFIMSQPVRFYAIAMPTINVTRFPDNSGSGFVNLSLSGYLVDE